MKHKIYVIAGEASGDLHGARLIEELERFGGDRIEIYGVGGDRIRETHARNFYDLAKFHVTGVSAAIKKLPEYRKAGAKILEDVRRTNPSLVVLIDNPGFNLHLASRIKTLGIPVIYYIAPQVWAWAPKRIEKIRRDITKVLVVFEFEKKLYEDAGIPVAWVGHPLRDFLPSNQEDGAVKKSKGRIRIALMPGSRKGEVKGLLDAFLGAAKIIQARHPSAEFVLLKSPTLPRDFYERSFKKAPSGIRLVEDRSYAELGQADLALVCSGTATLECALLGVPMIISYRASLLTYLIARAVIRVPFLGLPNLVLGEPIIPELLQYDASPDKIAAEALSILEDDKRRTRMEKDLLRVARRIGEPGASARTAREILSLLDF